MGSNEFPGGASPAVRQPTRDGELPFPRAEYTFDRFIKGDGNHLACAACEAVAESPGQVYNPLFLYGQAGLGKTHLLHAIGNAALGHRPSQQVTYITSERFAIELVNAIRQNRTDRFRRTFRRADVLLIDDVHFLKDKKGTQEELFHTFNELHESGKQIVLSSDRPPGELSQLQERLVSRFRWGLVADLRPPNYETRLAILRAKAGEHRLDLDDRTLDLIAHRVRSSVRALEGALIRVTAYADLQGTALTTERLDDLLPDENSSAPSPDIDRIKREVARHYDVSVAQLEGKQRDKRVSQARHVAIYLARELTGSSFPTIGRAFGYRDHTTAMHACRKVGKMAETSPLSNELERIRDALCEETPNRGR